MNAFSIKDIELISGIKAPTLRIWELRYQLIDSESTNLSGHAKRYSATDLKKVIFATFMQKLGFRVSKLQNMELDEIITLADKLENINDRTEKQVIDLICALLDIDFVRFEQIVNQFAAQNGIERTLKQLVIPFLEKTRLLDRMSIHGAQYAMVNNLLKSYFIKGIETASPLFLRNRKILLFAPAGSSFEMGLYLLYYQLTLRGFKVTFLGPDIDVKVLTELLKSVEVDHFVADVRHVKRFSVEKYIYYFHQNIPDIPLVLTGSQISAYEGRTPKNVILQNDIHDVVRYLQSTIEYDE